MAFPVGDLNMRAPSLAVYSKAPTHASLRNAVSVAGMDLASRRGIFRNAPSIHKNVRFIQVQRVFFWAQMNRCPSITCRMCMSSQEDGHVDVHHSLVCICARSHFRR